MAVTVPQDPLITVIDSFQLPICRFGRVPRRPFQGMATFGYDEVAMQTFYGFRAHVRLSCPGVITDFRLATADVHDIAKAAELLQGQRC